MGTSLNSRKYHSLALLRHLVQLSLSITLPEGSGTGGGGAGGGEGGHGGSEDAPGRKSGGGGVRPG